MLQKLRSYSFWVSSLPPFFFSFPLLLETGTQVLQIAFPLSLHVWTLSSCYCTSRGLDKDWFYCIQRLTIQHVHTELHTARSVPLHQVSGCSFEELYIQRWQFPQFTSSCLNWYFSFTYCVINTTEKYNLHASLRRYKNHWDCWAKVVTRVNRWNCIDLLRIVPLQTGIECCIFFFLKDPVRECSSGLME